MGFFRKRRKPQRHCEETARAHRERKSPPLEVLVSNAKLKKTGLADAVYQSLGGIPYVGGFLDEIGKEYPSDNIKDWVTEGAIEVDRAGKTEKQKKRYYDFDSALKYVLEQTSWNGPKLKRNGETEKDHDNNVVIERKRYSNETGSIMVALAFAAHYNRRWVGIEDGHLENAFRRINEYFEKGMVKYSQEEMFEAVKAGWFKKQIHGEVIYFVPTANLANILVG